MKQISFVGLLLLGACGPDLVTACESYIDASNSCTEEAYGDALPDGVLLDSATYCAAYDGVKGSAAKSQAKQLDCYADEINAVDCSDAATVGTGLTDALSACPLE